MLIRKDYFIVDSKSFNDNRRNIIVCMHHIGIKSDKTHITSKVNSIFRIKTRTDSEFIQPEPFKLFYCILFPFYTIDLCECRKPNIPQVIFDHSFYKVSTDIVIHGISFNNFLFLYIKTK